MKKLVLIVICLALHSAAQSCTVFSFFSAGRIYLCKNFDYERVGACITYNPATMRQYSGQQAVSWEARYRSLTINLEDSGKPLAGINERGLVVEELSAIPFSATQQKGKLCLDEFQWVQYQLDNYASVQEVIECIDQLVMVPDRFCLHYYIIDACGNAAIVEFENGTALVYRGDDLPYTVLSNNPYRESLRYLNCFIGFGGDHAIPESVSSNDRFVRMADLLKDAAHMPDRPAGAFALLDQVRQHDTQWQLVYDPIMLSIHLRTGGGQLVHVVQLEAFLGSNVDAFLFSDLYHPLKGWAQQCMPPFQAK